MKTKKQLRCVKCGKVLDGGGYICLENWLQWHHYTKRGPSAEANCYCSKECFADDWMVEWMEADEFEWSDDGEE